MYQTKTCNESDSECRISLVVDSAVSSGFFFNDTATTEIYTLSLHDALPISGTRSGPWMQRVSGPGSMRWVGDRKSTRLNSSHGYISYAVFCLKKKKEGGVYLRPYVRGLPLATLFRDGGAP